MPMRGLARSVALALLPWVMASAVVAAAAPHSFPDDDLVADMATLSHGVYHLRNKVTSCRDAQARNATLLAAFREETSGRWWWATGDVAAPADLFRLLLPAGAECLHYSHDTTIGTQVLVARSVLHNYVAVSYAGTDDWRTVLSDGDLLTSDFGPAPGALRGGRALSGAVPAGVRVHRGFNAAVFDGGGFRAVRDCVAAARAGGDCEEVEGDGGGAAGGAARALDAPHRLFTTGHSLGAANSMLLGAALHLEYPNETLTSINFGCPKVGNTQWSYWLDSLQPDRRGPGGAGGSYEVFRFVNKIDLVPRLPLAVFSHAGHTLQITYGGEIEAYYDHVGNEDRGYSGVPLGWEAAAYAFLPGALLSHIVEHYVDNVAAYRANGTGFERVDDAPALVPPRARSEEDTAGRVSAGA